MGILNVTPDSFSDGGRFADVSAAVDQGLRLAAEGADILDIGGESTRPYADPVDAKTELDRVLPVITALKPRVLIPLSIDTSKAAVARGALAVGVDIINDVTGLEGDPRMLDLARDEHPGICVMHMQGTPQDMQDNPVYDNVVEDVLDYLRRRRDHLLSAGIEQSRIALDPGIGFGKAHQHNLRLLANCHRFHELGCPILVGHSRKGFIAKAIGDKTADPTAGTIGVALALASQGVQILRVHDVLPLRQALVLYEASGGIGGQPLLLD
ncbi:MAG: dihydropteroate synthase [Planctomycetia bacterium]|nr:dihydropteroate synthase [Planctomycetia bacterium]